MEVLLYIDQCRNIQNDIIYNSDDGVIKSLYHLLLHHECSVDFFIKTLFEKGYHKSNATFFRENTTEFAIIVDYLNKEGGNFNLLAEELILLAQRENMSKHNFIKKPKREHQIVTKAIEIIERLLMPAVSDVLIDFCAHMCIFLNDFYKSNRDIYFGEKLVCSFIFFRIITPEIIKLSSDKQLIQIQPLICLLNRIALGDKECDINEHGRIRNIIARILMKRKKANYSSQYMISPECYQNHYQIILEYLKTSSYYHEIVTNCNIKYSFETKSMLRANSAPIKISDIITKRPVQRKSGITNDPKYFLLWTADEVMAMAVIENLDIDFLSKWRLDGKNFLQLTEEILKIMEIGNDNMINNFMRVVNQINDIAINNINKLNHRVHLWTCEEICIWLILNDLEHLVDIFDKNNINSIKLLKTTTNMLLTYGISCPRDIHKLHNLKSIM